MRKQLFLAGVAATLIIPTMAPSVASAQSCQQRSHDNRTAGTVIGAIGGALLGNAVSKHGGKPGGTIIGGVAGAAIGNQIGRKSTNCDQYGFYDSNGTWHNSNDRYDTAYNDGYYDSNGYWHSRNAPYRGYSTTTTTDGYYDSYGTWHSYATTPYRGYSTTTNADGYYDSYGTWHSYTTTPYRGYSSTYGTTDYTRVWRDSYGRRCSYKSRWVDDAYGTREREYYTVCR